MVVLGDMIHTGAYSEIFLNDFSEVLPEDNIRAQFQATFASEAEDEGSAAARVLCPEANGVRHCALAVNLAVRPCADHMSLCIPS